MKKIMFNDKYGLTNAVLNGNKTMTRRNTDSYKVGEVVAIAQSYKDVIEEWSKGYGMGLSFGLEDRAGMNNKMFVKSEYMPHHIRILSKRQEHLQDISRSDCLKEGIFYDEEGGSVVGFPFAVAFYYAFQGNKSKETGKLLHYSNARDAFLTLIDKVSGKGTWDSNPLVWVYEFELID